MFVDHIKIHAKAGDGGNGCCSFRRMKFVPKGGPDGGDGGRGGNVYLEVDPHTDNLRDFFYRPRQKAEPGKPGKGDRKNGKSGKHLILKVPPGTIIYRCEAPEPKVQPGDEVDLPKDYEFLGEVDGVGEMVLMDPEEGLDDDSYDEEEEPDFSDGPDMLVDDNDFDDEDFDDEGEGEGDESESPNDKKQFGEIVADLTTVGERFLLLQGGQGGQGNWVHRSDTNQAPLDFTFGTPGEEGWFYLELRKIADVGLVGFPNAGKSTLLGAISNATPKVAAYPFTTLQPMVGVVEFPGYVRTTVADIPGLIEGAHRNIGLGHDFLRHISRCNMFLFVVDAAAVDLRDPIQDLEILRKELKLFDEELSQRPWIIVANKIDLEESELFLESIRNRFPNQKVFAISAKEGHGIEELRQELLTMVGQRPL